MVNSFSNMIQSLNTGFEKIDEQHRFIDDTINRLGHMMATRNPNVHRVIKEIKEFYVEHFIQEELELECLDGFREHRDEHTHFLEELRDVNSPDKLLILMRKWNDKHIIEKDIPDFERLRMMDVQY